MGLRASSLSSEDYLSNNTSTESLSQQVKTAYSGLVFHPPEVNKEYEKLENHYKIKSKNGSLISYFKFSPRRASCKYIVWSHGNSMNSYQLEELYKILAQRLQINIIAYDYQGYGFSQGSCGEQNCYEDIESIIEHLKSEYDVKEKDMYLIGQSLGTGVVVDYVANHKWENPVLLISPYKSILTTQLNSIGNYVESIDMFKSISKIGKVTCPVKIVHGKQDSLINVSHAIELYEALPNKKLKITLIDNCDHNNILSRIEELFNKTDHYVYGDILN